MRPWQKKAPFSNQALGAVLSKGRVLVTADRGEQNLSNSSAPKPGKIWSQRRCRRLRSGPRTD
jgi:hypothetical protein